MKELLGFAVLTGPLWLILIALILGVAAAFIVAKRLKSGGAKAAAVIGVLAGAFLILFGDELAGRAYLNYLCATEAGVKVYHTVELPGEYWDKESRPKYQGPNGFVDMKLLPERFEWHKISEPYFDFVVRIEKWRWQLIDKSAQAVLGEEIVYMRHFGWMNRFSTAPNIGESCRDLRAGLSRDEVRQKERAKEQKFFGDIFKPAAIRKE